MRPFPTGTTRNGFSGAVSSVRDQIDAYLLPSAEIDWSDENMPVSPVVKSTPGLEANRSYFDHPGRAACYLKHCHRCASFRSRWLAATGSWDNKIVIDIGCGPGNVFATMGGKPKVLIGVDVSRGSLEIARRIGYLPVEADAHALPFVSGFADIVVLNAAIHHCDDMAAVLAEAARLVAPGGVLVTDHDPQLTAWNFRGPAKWAWNLWLTDYLWFKKEFHRSGEEQSLAFTSAIHHKPGDGVTPDLFQRVLRPLGFKVELHPHNHDVGAEVFIGKLGRSAHKFRIAQRLSGINPNSREAALSLLCRATRLASC